MLQLVLEGLPMLLYALPALGCIHLLAWGYDRVVKRADPLVVRLAYLAAVAPFGSFYVVAIAQSLRGTISFPLTIWLLVAVVFSALSPLVLVFGALIVHLLDASSTEEG
jgi:hypothetical protein